MNKEGSFEGFPAIKSALARLRIKRIRFVSWRDLEGQRKRAVTKHSRSTFNPAPFLIHDKERTHKKLVEKLSLKSKAFSSKDLKGLADSENPLNPINRVHCLLKMFLNAHSGFSRDDLQGYLNLYAFVINPPYEPLEKVEKLINLAFERPKLLRYREQFK